jgi:hypothetical protein
VRQLALLRLLLATAVSEAEDERVVDDQAEVVKVKDPKARCDAALAAIAKHAPSPTAASESTGARRSAASIALVPAFALGIHVLPALAAAAAIRTRIGRCNRVPDEQVIDRDLLAVRDLP